MKAGVDQLHCSSLEKCNVSEGETHKISFQIDFKMSIVGQKTACASAIYGTAVTGVLKTGGI